ncbi:MAG: hypothetical protein UX38_C0004G0059 [Microgenomates group bacterium GW2011_GWC1_46_16]|uniref:Uncharacterized protein n=2 Tax=Candidatus Collieribacteriota TaxID=1752725 RepID=A0A1F5G031_9BACT|nr:MAG: hypothetical protein UX32_C0003G0035 [Microgenomates group bacterium GW2011_GWF1_46_12]KKU26679.1 MAG: hypothetical protein UX38_C0004G0059 [Microgenomates group bacterium GW2011_GWC1_46_16]KKU28070.1 MAG: hypothetical protein UX40_C0003G0017 [Microgenomates group bacterium GW2011_GWF2_46_18]KKU45735.1 MAG: hypothetical protein UX63_C0001G0016 [Microgenomates group bacterium GW2011_GWB1_46_7]KKU60537.1 MAG: hypothetical protein UX82_C0010G0041 [Microgenomates group bacterium GW2011_GWE1
MGERHQPIDPVTQAVIDLHEGKSKGGIRGFFKRVFRAQRQLGLIENTNPIDVVTTPPEIATDINTFEPKKDGKQPPAPPAE